MAKASIWADVKVFMSDAGSAPVAITGISKATEAVVTTASTAGLANGDFVLISAVGMSQVNARVFKIKSLVANTSFVLEGENSTNYDTFSSGTWSKYAMTTTLSSLTTVQASGGEPDSVPTTTIHDKQQSSIPGLASASEYSFDSIWDASDAALIASKQVSDVKGQRAFQIKFSNGQFIVFFGYIFTGLQPGGSTGGLVTTKVKITAQGSSTIYAS